MGIAFGPKIRAEDLSLCIDAANIKSWSENVHPKPNDIGAWITTGNGCTITRDSTVVDSPVNGLPMKMVVTGSDPHITSTETYLAAAAQNQTWTVSVYAKANTATTGELFALGLNSSNTYIEAPSGTINITTSWQRFLFTYTFTNASTAGIAIRLDGPNSGFGTNGTTPPTIWWDGLQVERNSSASRFSPIYNPARVNVYDQSMFARNCTLNSGTTVDRTNTPISFNTNATTVTSSNYINTPTIEFLDQNGYTLDFWVKMRSGATSTFHSLTGQQFTQPWISLYNNDTTGLNWYVRYRDDTTVYRDFPVINDWNIQTNWTNIILSVDSARNISFYLNGVLRQTLSTAASTYMKINTIGGGYSSGGTFYPFQGLIGMAKVYGRTLSDYEAKESFVSVRSRFGV